MNDTQKSNVEISQDLSAGALSQTTTFGRRFKLESIEIHTNVAITETITISKVLVDGTAIVIGTGDLVAETDYVHFPRYNDTYLPGEEIKIQCTNANLTGTLTGVIKTSALLQ